MRYIGIAFLIGLLLACGSGSATQPTIRPAAPAATIAAAPATAAPEPTAAPAEPPTIAPAAAPAPPALGAAPKGSDCPDDHPVKGNIVDRGGNKGDKIYHLPSSSSYKATKPEHCFVDAKEAELAGYRAPK